MNGQLGAGSWSDCPDRAKEKNERDNIKKGRREASYTKWYVFTIYWGEKVLAIWARKKLR